MTPPLKSARSITKRYGIPTIDLIRAYLGLIPIGTLTSGHVPSAPRASSRPIWTSKVCHHGTTLVSHHPPCVVLHILYMQPV
jgi:hypothetical protein